MNTSHDERNTAGLFANGQRVPLTGVSIDIKASGVASRVTVSQRYRNIERVPIEAVYSFPIEESAAICGFEAEIDGRRIVGRVEEKEKAFETYDDAMANGDGAFLLDQDRPNIFTASVGNLLPGQEVVIRLSYVTELQQRGHSIRLLVPTTISPRYVPPTQEATIDPAELDHLRPPVLADVPYGLTLCALIETTGPIESVECPSHPARVTLGERSARVELMGAAIQMDRDFVVSIRLSDPHQTSALVACDDEGERVVMLNLFPDLSHLQRPKSEIIFLLDRSGSMRGDSMNQARNALQLCLRSLEDGDFFNVIGFGSTFTTLFRNSMPYNQQSLDAATRHVQRVSADLGGTELMGPLSDIVNTKVVDGRQRQVILLTDGQVSNEAECIALVGKHADRTRIFTFGIGHGASEHLVRGLARATRGEAEMIHPNERIEAKVTRQFNRLASAGLTEILIDWGALELDLVAPAGPPALFDGDRATFYARLTSAAAADVTITAQSSNGLLRFSVRVDPEHTVGDSSIGVLMARRAIQDLEEGQGHERGSAQSNRRQKNVEKKIIELACRYRLMSRYTSFVAVSEHATDQKSGAQAELRRIPIALTKGWAGLDQRQPAASAGAIRTGAFPAAPMAMPRAARSRSGAKRRSLSAGRILDRAKSALLGRLRGSVEDQACLESDGKLDAMEAEKDAVEAKMSIQAAGGGLASSKTLMSLCLLQTAAGYWELTPQFAVQTDHSVEALHNLAVEQDVDRTLAAQIVATVVALCILDNRYGDQRQGWKSLARKAQRWLDAQQPINAAALSSLRNRVAGSM